MSGRSTKRWSANGEAARTLRNKFLSGEIDPNCMNGDEIYNSHSSFMQYEGKTFKANLNRTATAILEAGGVNAWAGE